MVQNWRRLPILHGMSSLLAAAATVSTDQLVQAKTQIVDGLKALADALATSQLAPVLPSPSVLDQIKTFATE